ncbi:MAG: PKD domain-containing protein [Vicinamibacteraceae bacterium]
MRHVRLWLLLSGLALAVASPASPPERPVPVTPLRVTPLLVTYGHDNRPREGDPDFYQILYVSVPATLQDRISLRLFDPDTGGAHDLAFGWQTPSETRFAVFGGPAAYRPEASRKPVQKERGRLLAERAFGADPDIDDTWQTLAELDPADGALVDGRRVFRLLVDGGKGDEANAFSVAVGVPGDEQRVPQGVEIFSVRPTIRIPDPGVVLELPLKRSADVDRLTIDSFDARGAKTELALPLRSMPIPPSGDNEWQSGKLQLTKAERDGPAAIVISGGREKPNDLTLFATDAHGRHLPLLLPPRQWPTRNVRPAVVADVKPSDCHTVTLDAGRTSDAEGETLRFRWRFHDGSEANGPRVTRRYDKPGTYRARLEVRDTSPQVGHGSAQDFTIEIKSPPVASAKAPRLVAPGEPVLLDGSASKVERWVLRRYGWTVSDGTTLEGRSVQHAFDKPGRYDVTLTVEDDSAHPCRIASDTVAVIVNQPPVAAAGTDRRAASGEALVFNAHDSADRDGRVTAYRWDFGDGTTARGSIAKHTYASSGQYRVRLAVTDDSKVANATTSDEITVVVNAPPVAVLESEYVGGGVVRFNGSGSRDEDGAIARYAWNFGDGSTGSGPTPSHVYTAPGTYEVWMMVADDSGTIHNAGRERQRVVVNAAPMADAGSDIVTARGEEVALRGDGSVDPDGEIVAFQWDLGDGTTASGPVVRHTYETPGTYFARLTVRDNSAHDEAIDVDQAKVVVNRPPRADAGPDILSAPSAPVRLDARRSFDPDGKIANMRWDFSDTRVPQAGRLVERTFDAPGIYTAQLTVADNSGVSSGTGRDEVTIRINHAPVARAGADVKTTRRTIVFDGAASADADGDPLSFHWNFGDGKTARGARVSHTYAAGGTFPVVLTVEDGSGVANHRHRDSLTVEIDRPPTAVAGKSREVCTGDVVVFDGGGSRDPDGGVLRHTWDFGDGTSSDIVNPTKTYEKSGTYPVTLSVEDDSGLEGNRHADRTFVRVHQGPAADAGDDLRACANTPVQFDGRRSTDRDGVVNGFTWDFGDGASGGGDRPTHVYSRAGRYRASLTIEGDQVAQCDNTDTDDVEVEIVAAATAVINAPEQTRVSTATRFDGSASVLDGGRITAWRWSFGDGTTAAGPVVEHRYAKPGVYRVGLTVESDAKGSDCEAISAHQLVTVNAAPVAVAGSDRTVSAGEAIRFDGSASRDPDGALTSYLWDFGDGAQAKGMQVAHSYSQAGRYEVTLTVMDDGGRASSRDTDTLEVSVAAPPQPRIEGPAVACAAEKVRWHATGVTAKRKASYRWHVGDGARADGPTVTHVYRQPGRYAVTLFLDNGSGLANSQSAATRDLRINAPPRAVAGDDRMACPNVPLTFKAAGSKDPDGKMTAWGWTFGDGTAVKGYEVKHTYAEPGVYEATLAVTDDSGSACATATDGIQVVVQAPPVADAGPDKEVWIGGANDALLLDGSGSTHAEGRTLDYTWTLPDGTVLEGQTVKHVLSTPGEYDITLRIDDLTGRSCGVSTDTLHVVARARTGGNDGTTH